MGHKLYNIQEKQQKNKSRNKNLEKLTVLCYKLIIKLKMRKKYFEKHIRISRRGIFGDNR